MKTFLTTGILLASLAALASSPQPHIYQYWFDEDIDSRIRNTNIYDAQSDQVSIDASGLSEGGHAVRFRMANNANQWGGILTKYFVVGSDKEKENPEESTAPVMMQYWFDSDEAMRVKTTQPYDGKSDPLVVDASGLSEGGHALRYRLGNKFNRWGTVMTRYFTVPSEPDKSSPKPTGYRVCINNEVIATGEVPNDTNFTITPKFPANPVLSSVKSRDFKYLMGEGKINMDAVGTFTCAFQMLSENDEWGAPLISEITRSVTTKLQVDSVPVPYDYTFSKPDLNNFKAYKFYNKDNSCLYFKASQDCDVSIYYVYTSNESNLSRLNTFSLKKGETYKYETSSLNNRDLIAVVYNTETNKANPNDSVFLRIMHEDNKLPKPIIKLDSDTWELTITCADERATIHYTLDGEDPDRNSPIYSGPIVLNRFTRVKAFAVYGDLADSNVEDIQYDENNMQIPRPKLEYAGGEGMNEFIFTNRVEGVTTYYVLGSGNLSDETQRVKFDGKPFVIENGTSLKAYCVKDQLADSEVLSIRVSYSDYITSAPSLYNTKTEGDIDGDLAAVRNFIMLSVPAGKAKYRILSGKHDFAYGTEINESDWTPYDEDWLELPGGPYSGNKTVQVFSEAEGKARSAVVSIYTDWIKAVKPQMEYDNYHLKLSSEVPGCVIKYNLGSYDAASALDYKAEELPDGIDMKGNSRVTAWTQAAGYVDSDRISVYSSDFNLESPLIEYREDGYLHVTHDSDDVNVIVSVDPEQEMDTVAANHIRFIPEYNTTVEAYAAKKGFNNSGTTTMNPLPKPKITVDGYYVTIDNEEGEVYYTIDGSRPTKLSARYTGAFETSVCTVRAAAFRDGMIPAEADSAKVMDQAAMPEIEINNGFAKLTTTTPDATIYYSLNQSISAGNRQVYDEASMPEGIDINDARTLYAYAEAEGYRRSETLDFFKSNFTLNPPTLKYSNGYVVADHEDSEVAILFADDKGNAIQPEAGNPRRVKVEYNSIVDASAYKKGFVASKAVRMQPTDAPEISVDLFTVSMTVKNGQTVRYTTDGSIPGASSAKYEEPFQVKQSCTVRAVAFAQNLIPAEGKSVSITYKKNEKPQVKNYDGRFLTLSAEEGATMRYLLDESGDVTAGAVVDGSIDMLGINEIRVIALSDAADYSDEFSFIPEYYADGKDAYISKAGVLKDAFGWCDDMSGFTALTVHGPLAASSGEDSGDYEFIRSIPNLRYLDLRDVTDTHVPDGALDAPNLRSVVLPTLMKTAGNDIFGESNSTLSAIEIPGDDIVPEFLLSGVKNSNLLLYVRKSSNASKAIANSNGVVRNVVVLDGVNGNHRAESVTLDHGMPFCAPKDFTAQKISFRRSFTKETSIGGFGSGWETMVVPFDVQSIECGDKTLKPFDDVDTERGECPFWLFSPAENEWKAEISMLANTPYLIAMPNNPLYADEFVVNGDVVFSSNNVSVPLTPERDDMTFSFGTGRYIAGNYELKNKGGDVLAINEMPVIYRDEQFKPGGIFIADERDVPPFECYVMSSGASSLPVFDRSAVDGLIGDYGTLIWSESCDICIRSSISMKLRIYDTVGQLIRIVDVKAGETVRVSGITPGIYFVGSTKILVKG